MHAAIAALSSKPEPDAFENKAATERQPAVSARKSLFSRKHVLSMIDGKPYKTVTRRIARHA